MNIKKILVGAAAGGLMLSSMATVVLAAPPDEPGRYGTASPNAQCGTAASSGAFNFQNEVYGVQSTPGGVSDSWNSSSFGLDGGSGGGQTGINNSTVCGNKP
jgi:hypothetical protein